MSKKILFTLFLTFGFVCAANAYPQNYFGTGYSFNPMHANLHNGAVESTVINTPVETFTETKNEETGVETFTMTKGKVNPDKKVSTIFGNHDEAANAGYKKTDNYVINDGEDYNPYTGDNSNVNKSKSIYTDSLGRSHFFGKANRFRTTD